MKREKFSSLLLRKPPKENTYPGIIVPGIKRRNGMKKKLANTKVAVTVTLNVSREDFTEPKLSIKDIRAAALYAVAECLNRGEGEGFNHSLENIVSIGVEKVEVARELSRLL
jgi:hypothetical protein